MTEAKSHILQVNTADVDGGAERVALDLHREYRSRDVGACLAVGHRRSTEPGVIEIPNEARRSGWERSLVASAERLAGGRKPAGVRRLASRAMLLAAAPGRYSAIGRGLEDFAFPATADILGLPPHRPAVLHLHNLHGYYFDLRLLPELSAGQPTLMTMHDPWLLTGHCAHPIDCPRWRAGCGECPHLDRYVPIRVDASAEDFALKRRALAASRLHYATPSRWLMRMLEESGVLEDEAEARVIPNGIDTKVFAPGDRKAARERVGLPLGARIVLFAAQGLANSPFKDYETLREALRRVAGGGRENLVLLALGDASAQLIEGVDVRALPFTDDVTKVAEYYRAADLYVHAARAENLPLAVMEAMACGTPVVASRVGGIPEIVAEGGTGLLAEPGDDEALAAAIETLLGDEERRRAFAHAGVARVGELFTLERMAEAYLEWYSELLSQRWFSGPASWSTR